MSIERDASQSARSVALIDVLALLGLALASFALVAKNLAIDNSVVFHDEYLYKVWADATIDHAWMLQQGVVPPMPNLLFAWVYRPAAHAGLNAYDFAQLLNVGFWAVGCIAAWALARRLRADASHMAALGIALVSLPLSSYTKYFMPEAMYTGLFLVASWLLLDGQIRGALARIGLSGALFGAMYFVKPHALFAIGIGLAFTFTCTNRWRSSGALLAGFVAAFAAIRALLAPLAAPSKHGLGVYEDMLRSLSERLAGYVDGPFGLLLELRHVAAPHVALFVALFGVPLVVTLGQVFPRIRLLRDASVVDIERRLFGRFLLIATVALMGVAILFTVLAGEVGRVHARYYMFLFPLWLVQMALLRTSKLNAVGAVAATAASMLGIGWLWIAARGYAPVLSISHVSDGPEWGMVFSGKWFYVCLGLLAATNLWATWRGHGGKGILLAVAFVSMVATFETAVAQKSVFRNGATDGRDAVAVEQLIGKAALRRLVVVGPNAGEVDKFLFFLRDVTYVDFRPESSPVENIEQRFPRADWFVTITAGYVVSDRYVCQPVGRVRLCSIPEPRESRTP